MFMSLNGMLIDTSDFYRYYQLITTNNELTNQYSDLTYIHIQKSRIIQNKPTKKYNDTKVIVN